MKKIFLSLAIVIIGIAVVAFAIPEEKQTKSLDTVTYVYLGDNSETQQKNEMYYWKDETPDPCTGDPERICLLEAPDNGDHPDFSNGNPIDDPELFNGSIVFKPFQ